MKKNQFYQPTGRQFSPFDHFSCHRYQPIRQPPPPRTARSGLRRRYTIHLCFDSVSTHSHKKPDLESLILQCTPKPERVVFNSSSGCVLAWLYFQQWADVVSCVTRVWELRLSGVHSYTPEPKSNDIDPLERKELEQRLREVFIDYVNKVIEGEEVKRWELKLDHKVMEISRLAGSFKKLNLVKAAEMLDRKRGLEVERGMIKKRIMEFKSALRCILNHLRGAETENFEKEGEWRIPVFKFDDEVNWGRIHKLVLREISRLDEELPIYGQRQEILRIIEGEQAMVLIGETGSGKSTQLVQFLSDSGVAADGCIVCTQPRKIAATSLSNRVEEESRGCYGGNSVISYPTFSSSQNFDSRVIYMTDHCLLQHYINDRYLSRISCIIIDEAHERSLNTDLLLALLKDLLRERSCLRLVIMSATADANQLSNYYFGCTIFHMSGRKFAVDIVYAPCTTEGNATVAPYACEVVRVATEIHKTEEEGSILAFLTSQMEVEWACEKFQASSAVALPLHGKLSFEEQCHVFQNYPGKRKIIFATNLAETSVTIPGVRYVVDCGMAKESKFEPGTGMHVLEVGCISQSSAQQRAGRAGRTGPGKCYRLYSEQDYESMPLNQEPEIRRVHLGIAILRILALGINDIKGFDFVDAPSAESIDMTTRNLVQLGAITLNKGVYELTDEGRYLVKLGVEPRLGKLILGCFHHCLGREGLVLAAVMANASNMFCRVGSHDDKLKADCLKLQFCHQNGDLFTLLSVYKEWTSIPANMRNKWCWENKINAKSMWRCHDTVKELELCLEKELAVIIPSYWLWDPYKSTEHDKYLKMAILAAFAENVAMYSGSDQLGYEVALTGKHFLLHPSCSLLAFSEMPSWVVFGELLSVSNQYLVCVTSFEYESLSKLLPPPLFDASKMEMRKLQRKVMTGFGSTMLKRFCGKSNCNILSLLSHILTAFMDERINVEVNPQRNEILLFASSKAMDKVFSHVKEAVEYERKWLHDECMEKYLYHRTGGTPSMALFGGGAEIKHLELEKRYLTVDIFYSDLSTVNDKELLVLLHEHVSGGICAIQKSTSIGQEGNQTGKWGRITFLTPEAAQKAAELNEIEFNGSVLKVLPSQTTLVGDHKMSSFPAVRAKVYWPRRQSKGLAIVKCDNQDVCYMVCDFANLVIGGKNIHCEAGKKDSCSVVVKGFDKELSEDDILNVLKSATKRRIVDLFIVRGGEVENPPLHSCEEAILRELSKFIPRRYPNTSCCSVQVLPPDSKHAFMKALITFDGRLHLEAAEALENLEGKVLPGCLSWQKLKCKQLFHSSISCSASVYSAIRSQLNSLLASLRHIKGIDCSVDRNENGSYRVRITANATRKIALLRQPLEVLMKGQIVDSAGLTPTVLQHLFSVQGINLMKSIQRETGTYILFTRQNYTVRVFGSPDKVALAQQKLIQSLVNYHENQQLQIHLRGGNLPPYLMKELVMRFGPDLNGIKEMVPDLSECTLNTRRHVISIIGTREMKMKLEEIVHDFAQTIQSSAVLHENEASCPICFCKVEDSYQLENCQHLFCRSCLVEQFESAIKNLDSFPVCCTSGGCKAPILLADLKCLLSSDKLEELFRASLGSFVASSGGTYRFCPSPDCPSVYRVADPGTVGEPFVCEACNAETCTKCHFEYHPYVSCERYKQYKEDPDSSLEEWRQGKDNVRDCPVCGYTIEKAEGCNHIECKCGRHVCWVCLEHFNTSDDCYRHLRAVHLSIL
ncbi:hypothetical protein K2173_014863 [Erythroxylum novogranatense]|uniref:RNA helicase n=1 Tax=Erythroxylum novogranatense TaxID=1862640 RepID=A0AAV8TFZ9_9ROSI|nr:hypothetical protein K2173_014863 [Erythroxylum novogranatense]